MRLKIAIVGAGSLGFTRKIVRDILTVPDLQNIEFALTDIDQENLTMISQLLDKDIRNNPECTKQVNVTTTMDRREAIQNAKYILNTVRIGGLEAFTQDIKIPLKYGVDQCVGDTLCAGGIMYAQRGIPCILDFCRDIRDVAAPGALFINYANPMAMNVWAAVEYGGVNTLGLCHGVEAGWDIISLVLQATRNEIHGIAAGINHQTWFIKILKNGKQISSEQLLEAFENHPKYSKEEKCRIDVLRRFGYFSTESNGHLSEYLPWYRKRPEHMMSYISLDKWHQGETGGYLRLCSEQRDGFKTDFPDLLAAVDPKIGPSERSRERASYIIEALETGKPFQTYANLRNNGIIDNLPDDCMVEVPVYIDQTGINPFHIGELPLACAATCMASINVQRMAKEAAVKGDLTLLKQAMLHDPLTAAVCEPDEIWQMVDEMLVAQAKWLPQYQSDIPAAVERLKNRKIKERNYKGFCTNSELCNL